MAGYIATGIVTRDMLPTLGAIAPAVVLPAMIGMRLYSRINQTQFRRTILAILTLAGAAMLASSMPQMLAE